MKGGIAIPIQNPAPLGQDAFQRTLVQLFGDAALLDQPAIVGHVCYGQLSGDLRVRAELISTRVADQYDALKLTVLNRTEGQVDCLLLRFQTIWGKRNDVVPHIWVDGGQAGWYLYRPTPQDMDQLRNCCKVYLDVFREPVEKVPATKSNAKPSRRKNDHER